MVTELRVHGVGGSTVEELLDRPWVHQVAGDGGSGFYRPHASSGAPTGPGGATLEGYRWGSLTAGAAARAFWLLLLPFMLANLMMWLRPPSGVGTARVIRALCRLVALSVTGTFVLSFVGISVDLIGYQCAASVGCTRDRWYLTPLTTGFFEPTGRRLALLALVPLAAVGLLWYLGRFTSRRYEAFRVPAEADGDGLAHPNFWQGNRLVDRLRTIHVAAAVSTVDALLLGALVGQDSGWGRWPEPADWHGWAGDALAAATGLVLLGCVLAVCFQGMTYSDAPSRWAQGIALALGVGAVGLTGLTLGYALLPRDPWAARGGLPGYGATITVLFAVQLVLLVILGSIALLVRQRGAALGGLAAPVLGSIAVGLSVAFSAGLSYRVADFLDRAGAPSPADFLRVREHSLQPPASYEWSALGFVATVVVGGFVLALAWTLTGRRLRRSARSVTDADFPAGRGDDPARATEIDATIAEAQLSDHSGRLIALAYTPLAIAAVVVTGFALAGIGPLELTADGSAGAKAMSFTVNLGTYLIGLFALALLVLGVLAYRYPRVRRVVGVLWDVGTFWPRAAHPLAPPCYSERVVPELAIRAQWLAGQGGVILAGHSQGSVVSLAAVLQLPAAAAGRAALLTYGSPLRRMYARYFPAYLNDAVLARAGDSVADPGQHPRWANLWRDTDPIGGALVAPAAVHDVRMVDPESFGVPPGDTVAPAPRGHFGYLDGPAYRSAVSRLVAALEQPGAPGPLTH